MDFDDIWPRVAWILDDLRDGMCFFEGFMPTIAEQDLLTHLSALVSQATWHTLRTSVWRDDASESDFECEHSLAEYVQFFSEQRILLLHCEYERSVQDLLLHLKLIFERGARSTSLEVICYRDPILGSDEPKDAVRKALLEFRYLRQLFGGHSLFVGPDTLDYPESDTVYPAEWLRID